jgi:energy-coupling factor transport system ATP-binding protein
MEEYGLAACRRPGPLARPAPGRGSPILQARGLSYRYAGADREALRGIDLTIGQGEFLAILGRNGSGKTTLAKHFNGLLRPTAGQMLVSGRPTSAFRRHELARQVGYVFQNPDHQIFAPTVREEISFGLRVLGEDRETVKRRVAEAMAVTGLEGYGDKTPFLLSRGERQRVAVASVLAMEPRVIILDEPTTGLDDRHQRDAMEMLKRLHAMGHTVVMITHAMRIAEAYADRIAVMSEGQVIGDGETRRIFADEALLARASLIPSPLARLSNRLGLSSLTLEGMIEELKDPGT